MGDSERLVEFIQTISGDDKLSMTSKATKIAKELSAYFNTEIYFCDIKGKRWSYVTGSGDTVYGSRRLQLNDKWGIISDNELLQNSDTQLIINMIRGILSD